MRFVDGKRRGHQQHHHSRSGIGDELMINIREFHYSDISAILCIIIVMVFIIDMLNTRLRRYLLTGGAF